MVIDLRHKDKKSRRREGEGRRFEEERTIHVISQKKLREFWRVHPEAEAPLRAWFRVARRSDWVSFVDVRETYRSADQVGKFTVFDIGGNKYRLIGVLHYNRGKLFVRHVLTHADYDRGAWKRG